MSQPTPTPPEKSNVAVGANKKDFLDEMDEQVEGTVRLFDSTGHLRKLPIPSSNPADPLTWSPWKRSLVMLCLCVYGVAGFGVVQSAPLFFSALVPEYKKQTRGKFIAGNISELASYPSLCMGLGNFLFVPLSMMLGRRSVFLFNNALMIAAILWAAKSDSFETHLAARCLQGLSCGISDCLLPIMVLDMTFLHRRGLWMSFYWAMTAAGSSALLVVVPFAVQKAHSPWRANYWFWLSFAAFSFVVAIFCLPDTLFPRPAALIDGQVVVTDTYGQVRIINAEDASDYLTPQQIGQPENAPPSSSYLSQLKPISYKPNGFKRFIMTYVEMAICFINPSIIYVLILNTILFAGLVSLSITYAQQLESAPWHFSSSAVGTAQAGSVIGAIVALGISGITVDRLSGILTKRNGGVREPEHVLPSFFLPALFGFIGMILYGVVGGNPKNYPGVGWLAVHVAFGMYYYAFVALSAVTGVWIAEVAPHYSGAGLVLVCGGRNALSFGISDKVDNWVAAHGVQATYVGLGGALFGVIVGLGIPMFIWNKHIRRTWTRKVKFNTQ